MSDEVNKEAEITQNSVTIVCVGGEHHTLTAHPLEGETLQDCPIEIHMDIDKDEVCLGFYPAKTYQHRVPWSWIEEFKCVGEAVLT